MRLTIYYNNATFTYVSLLYGFFVFGRAGVGCRLTAARYVGHIMCRLPDSVQEHQAEIVVQIIEH